MNINDFFNNVLALSKADIIVAGAPSVIAYLTNIAKAPLDPVNRLTQLDLLRSSLAAAIPGLTQTEIGQLNGGFIGEVEAVLAQAQATVTAATTAQAAALAKKP